MAEGVEKALLTDLAPKDKMATAFGYFHVAIGVAALPASLITGLVWQRFGSHAAFLSSAALACVGAMPLLAVPRVSPPLK